MKPHPPSLAEEAIRAVTANGYETQPGFCQRFVREIIQHCCGDRYNAYFAPDAVATAHRFEHAGWGLEPERGSKPGDLLYKLSGSGGFGHVGIRVSGNRVAENSHVHYDPDTRDARGFRTLREFGDYDLIVRLP